MLEQEAQAEKRKTKEEKKGQAIKAEQTHFEELRLRQWEQERGYLLGRGGRNNANTTRPVLVGNDFKPLLQFSNVPDCCRCSDVSYDSDSGDKQEDHHKDLSRHRDEMTDPTYEAATAAPDVHTSDAVIDGKVTHARSSSCSSSSPSFFSVSIQKEHKLAMISRIAVLFTAMLFMVALGRR
jgi:hypothetical protein